MKWCKRLSLSVPVLLIALLFFGCATSPPANVKAVDCDAGKIKWDVTEKVDIVNFSCSLGKHGVDKALIYKLELQNTTDTPLRYRVKIFLDDMDKAAGHLVPRKGKPPVVAPGNSVKIKIPFIKTETMSNDVTVMVHPID